MQVRSLFTEGIKMLQEKIIDLATGEETLRDYTPEEMAEVAEAEAEAQALAQQQAQLETAKIAAQAKLAALGLTTNDLKALGLGGN